MRESPVIHVGHATGGRLRELIAVTLREWFLGSGVFALAMHGKLAAVCSNTSNEYSDASLLA